MNLKRGMALDCKCSNILYTERWPKNKNSIQKSIIITINSLDLTSMNFICTINILIYELINKII